MLNLAEIYCPNCEEEFLIDTDAQKIDIGCTLKCINPDCQTLLIVTDQGVQSY